ncbi:ATP-grasp domain-containing protein [bacterium]|jgi:D-alanine-D-alanine ligase|nr:ATP-grasp domain-containing protein [bacterium]
MKICVLQPDYSRSEVDYKHYDPPRDLARLLPEHEVHHVALNKLSTYRQLKSLAREGYDIFVNLCEGYLEWDIPSIDVIHTLELLNLPYTGATPTLYNPTKPLMKYVAHTVGVTSPAHVLVRADGDVEHAMTALRFPLFVKPSEAGDSLGIDAQAMVADAAALRAQVSKLLPEYPELLVEEYIDGREFTVLVVAEPDGGCSAFRPVEYRFPSETHFKTYAHKTSELHPEANVAVTDDALADRLKGAACAVFTGFNAVGYARMDFRMNAAGELFFLEVNFACSLFYADGYEGSADYIVKHDGIGQRGFALRIIAEGIARHARRQKCYEMRGSAISGYGIYARRAIAAGATIFCGEGRSQRIITRPHVRAHWTDAQRELFMHYAYPLSDEVYVLWSDDPTDWAPQNHCCAPNTGFRGLDVVALHDIAADTELTIDFAELLNEEAATFPCRCGARECRGTIRGTPGNSLTARLLGTSGRA